MKPMPITAGRLVAGDFLAEVKDDDLVYFCCNIGDADAQVILLPTSLDGVRRVIVVDAGATKKIPALLEALDVAGLVDLGPAASTPISLVVATHPHNDHIVGMQELFDSFGQHIAEFWEPGYFHTGQAYQNMMAAVAKWPKVVYTQPTSGMRRFFGPVAVIALSPAVQLRNRFDTYGVEINDSSISLRLEHPARALADTAPLAGGQSNWATNPKSGTIILGADAQTTSWAFVEADFPFLAASSSPMAKAIGAATGNKDLLSGDVLKVSHHASKHGVNLELIERIRPAMTLISSTAAGTKYGFPHTVAQELIREALDPVAGSPDAMGKVKPHADDQDLGIFYTSDVTTGAGSPDAGSFAVILKGSRRQLWRFGDSTGEAIDLAAGKRWT